MIIGEVIFGKLFHNFALKLLTVVFGAMLYYLVYQVVIWLGLNTDDMKLITALIVAVFLALPYWKGKYFRVKPAKSLSKPRCGGPAWRRFRYGLCHGGVHVQRRRCLGQRQEVY